MAKIQRLPEKTVELTFPKAGMDRSYAFDRQIARAIAQGVYGKTTILGKNVQTYEAITQRGRGGTRPGLSKLVAQQVPAGSTLIQELACVSFSNPNISGVIPAIARVQARVKPYAEPGTASTYTDSTGADTLAFSSNVTAGNTLFVVTASDTGSNMSDVAISDTLGTVYQLLESGQSSSSSNHLRVYAGIAPSTGANTVTVTRSTFFDAITIAVLEYSGINPFDIVDSTAEAQNNGYSAGTDNVSSGTVTVTGSAELVLGFFTQGFDDVSGDVWAAGTNFTSVVSQEIHTVLDTIQSLHVEERLNISGSIPAVATVSGTRPSMYAIGISFNPAASYLQASNAGRQVNLVAVAGGNVYATPVGGSTWSTAVNNTGTSPALYYNASDQRVVRSSQHRNYLYMADGSHMVRYNIIGNTVDPWPATAGTLPADASGNRHRLIATWRDRIVLAGWKESPSVWRMTAKGDPLDFDVAPSEPSANDACSSDTHPAGQPFGLITGLCSWSDDVLLIFCDGSLHAMVGDPMEGGDLQTISRSIGGAWGICWAKDPMETVYFASQFGDIYSLVPGGKPIRISQQITQLLQAITSGTTTTRLFWDDRFQALRVYITNSGAIAAQTHYVWEQRSGSWFQVVYANNNHNPQCGCIVDGNNQTDRVVAYGAWDGYVRTLTPSATTDDGTSIASEVWLGPIVDKDLNEFILHDLQAVMAESWSGSVTWGIYAGKSAELAFASTALMTGTFAAGRGNAQPVRRAGHAIYVKLTAASAQWAMETIRGRVSTRGKVRQRGF